MNPSTARVGAFAAAVAIGLSVAPGAWAKPGFAIVTLSPSKFVSNCQSMGGTTSSAPGGGIRCTLPSGQTVDCSFNTSDGTAVCQWSRDLPPARQKQLLGDPAPGTLNPNPSKPPKAGGATEAPGTVN
jgi:hypothetical protein